MIACGDDRSTTLAAGIQVRTPAGNVLDEIAFRNTPLGGHDDQAFLIKSVASVPLHVSGIDFEAADGTSAVAFSALTTFPVTIAPGLSHEVKLRFAPQEVRPHLATAVIRSDDPANGALRVVLKGEGVAGRLEVIACLPNTDTEGRRCADSRVSPPDPLHLGDVTAGAHAAALIMLRNGGGDRLDVSRIAFTEPSAAEAAGFTLPANASEGMRIPPGESGDFTVHFNPPAGDEVGPASATIRIESNSTTDPVVDVVLQAEVVPNTAPVACVFVREIRHVDGRTETFEPGAELPAVEPADVIVFDAMAREGCSGDPEDGDAITVEWTLTTPNGIGGLKSVGGEPMQRSLEAEASGDYRVDVLVRDSLGLEATADAAGRPASVSLRAVPRQDIAVEIGWADNPLVDVDLHFVRGEAALWDEIDATYWKQPTQNWGDPNESFDDPALLFDDQGSGSLVETAILNHPQDGVRYWVYARFYEDRRQRTGAATCLSDAECGALVCSAGRCMEPVKVHLKVFLDSVEVDLSLLPSFDNPAVLKSPCDTWLAGWVQWPASGSGSTAPPTFEMAGQISQMGEVRGGICADEP